MDDLLYYDGNIAICEEKWDYPTEKALGRLLSINVDSPDIENEIKPLLSCLIISKGSLTVELSEEQRRMLNANRLRELGFDIDGSNVIPSNILDSTYRLVFVSEAVTRITSYAAMHQYLAKLSLLANGDERMSSLIELPIYDEKLLGLSLEVTLPYGFGYNLDRYVLPTKAQFDKGSLKVVEPEQTVSIRALIHDFAIFRSPYFNGAHKMPNDDFEKKRICASALLSSLLSYQSQIQFTNNPDTLELERCEETLTACLGDAIIAGKIQACPWCGRPVFKKHDSSKPFCRKSHQTRYNEAAKKMLARGASVDEVADKYPHINRKTIENWPRG